MTEAATAAPALLPHQIIRIPVDLLVPDPDQPRTEFAEGPLAALAAELKAKNGPEQPLLVRSDYVIKDGERRWRAAKLAGLADLPCLLAAPAAEENTAIEWQLDQACVNHHREPLGPMDWARFLRKLVDAHGVAVKDVPPLLEKRGITMSRPYVSNLMRLVELPEWAQDMVKAGTLTAAHGKHILTAKDSAAVTASLKERITKWIANDWNGPLTTDELRGLVEDEFEATHPRIAGIGGGRRARFDTADCAACIRRKALSRENGEDDSVFCLDSPCFTAKQTEADAAAKKKDKPTAMRKPQTPKPDPKAEARRLQHEAEAIALTRARGQVAEAASGTPDAHDLRLLAEALLDTADLHQIAERRGWEAANRDIMAMFRKQAERMKADELHGLMLEMALSVWMADAFVHATIKRHKIDLKALEKTALAELKAKAAEKNAAEPKTKGKKGKSA